jgi:hypothetical protein
MERGAFALGLATANPIKLLNYFGGACFLTKNQAKYSR